VGNVWGGSVNSQGEQFEDVQLDGSVYPGNSCQGTVRHGGNWGVGIRPSYKQRFLSVKKLGIKEGEDVHMKKAYR